MKPRPRLLLSLSVAAAVAGMTGVIITVRSLVGLPQLFDSYRRKASDLHTLHAMQLTASRYREMLATNRKDPGIPVPLSNLLSATIPGCDVTIREREPVPTATGWIAKRFSVTLKSVSGDDLSRFLAEASRQSPVWTLQECTLMAATIPGQLAKAELVMGVVELDSSAPPPP